MDLMGPLPSSTMWSIGEENHKFTAESVYLQLEVCKFAVSISSGKKGENLTIYIKKKYEPIKRIVVL